MLKVDGVKIRISGLLRLLVRRRFLFAGPYCRMTRCFARLFPPYELLPSSSRNISRFKWEFRSLLSINIKSIPGTAVCGSEIRPVTLASGPSGSKTGCPTAVLDLYVQSSIQIPGTYVSYLYPVPTNIFTSHGLYSGTRRRCVLAAGAVPPPRCHWQLLITVPPRGAHGTRDDDGTPSSSIDSCKRKYAKISNFKQRTCE